MISKRRHGRLCCLTASCLLIFSGVGAADESESADSLLDALIGGDIYLNMRARLELADMDGREHAEALTLRTRLGYGTKPWHGVSIYGDFENIASPTNGNYFDLVSGDNGKTIVADPETTEVNQAYLKYSNEDLLGTTLIGGRQRLILDDARFIGNVGWRQNEQTFDAGVLHSSMGFENVRLTYGYLWDVNRIFGNKGPAQFRDFESDSHLINFSYSGCSYLAGTGFVYLLDFDNSPGNSSNSYGLRLHGNMDLADEWKLGYAASYAYQTDAGDNPVDYNAHYVSLDGNVSWVSAGTLGAGYELLGSDHGIARFVTPLATAHKFNGWADVFLDNGGVNGLRDLYVYLSPKLPWGLEGKIVYHHFEADHGNNNLGDEIDAVVSRGFMEYFTVRSKFAYYTGTGGADPVDRYRFWLELTFNL